MVFQLTYVSRAVQPWTQPELVALLEQSRTSNDAHGITGMLLYREGRFLQLLEGAEADVRPLYGAIQADRRHHDVVCVREGRRLLRQFPSWTMAFRDLDEEPLTAPGFSDVLRDDTGATDPVVDELVTRLRASTPHSRSAVSRVLGLVGGVRR